MLDLSGLEYMDSTGVGVLIGALKRFNERKREILLAAPQRRILAGLRVTHLDTLFRIYDVARPRARRAGQGERQGADG